MRETEAIRDTGFDGWLTLPPDLIASLGLMWRRYGNADSGDALVVELPGDRFVAIRSLEPGDDNSLMDDLLESNTAFRTLVARSKASARNPFAGG